MSDMLVDPLQMSKIKEMEELRVTQNKSQQAATRPKFAGQRDIDDFNNRVFEPLSPKIRVKINFDEVKLNIE